MFGIGKQMLWWAGRCRFKYPLRAFWLIYHFMIAVIDGLDMLGA